MFSIYNSSRRYLYITFVFAMVFSLIAYFYIQQSLENDRKYFKTHAAILADDLWALNHSGVKAYLLLAVNANNYKSLTVSIPGTDTYMYVTSAPLTGLSSYL